mmetsp:Transcript_106378/g.174615  ORF Transcript_106378/g.174615 Transcript_106378/m.174615 type:complete len:86 (-) Transcript_106378:56-313(-)
MPSWTEDFSSRRDVEKLRQGESLSTWRPKLRRLALLAEADCNLVGSGASLRRGTESLSTDARRPAVRTLRSPAMLSLGALVRETR